MGFILSIFVNTLRRLFDVVMNIFFRGVLGKDLNFMKLGNVLIFFKWENVMYIKIYVIILNVFLLN